MHIYHEICQELSSSNTTLVAVSKTKSKEQILELYELGQRIFGENRVQELCEKFESLPKDIQWHQIGHLQTNKVKYIAPFVSMIHAVDSVKLLATIHKEAKKNNRIIDILLQVHIAQEEHKFGFTKEETIALFDENIFIEYPNIRVRGLMGMATFTDDTDQISDEFSSLNNIFQECQTYNIPNFNQLSMGMSGDYKIAIQNSSTMVRIGSLLFGSR